MSLHTMLNLVLQSGLVPRGTRVQVFREIYWAFLILGTLVGVVVISYMLYNGYKYRYQGGEDDDEDRPRLGEMPTGGGKGKKLFLSFGLSAIIVISLIAWTYGALLYVEASPPTQDGDAMEIRVEGYQFGWEFTYRNVDGHEAGKTVDNTLVLPKGAKVALTVTSRDVMHNFGIPAFKVKADAMPGQTTDTWFVADTKGTYMAQCYELCGVGHSYMTAKVKVVSQSEFDKWYTSNSSS